MSFWTNIVFCHPLVNTPVITMRALAEFAERFVDCGLVNPTSCPGSASYRPGDRVDLDLAESDGWEDPTPEHPEGRFRDLPAEVDVFDRKRSYTPAERIAHLKELDEPVYRAFLSLGNLTQPVAEQLHRPSDENEQAFMPVGCSIEAGPVRLGNEDTAEAVGVCSLLAVTIGGPGYCWPRTHREVVNDATSLPEVSALAKLVREIWPVEPAAPPARVVEQRRQLGEFYMGNACDEPLDWWWGIEGI